MSAFEVAVVVERREARGAPFRVEAELRTRGGITVAFGPSGAGKSTLLLAILGALRPARGRIAVGGRVLFDAAEGIDLPVRERRLGIVFQDALLFPHLDALRNVAFGLRGGDRRVRAREMLEKVGASDVAGRMPVALSGGERQRVALARALAARPAALLLDEPFSALDSPSREALGGLLIRLQASLGVPFLHVTHDTGEALRLGTDLVVMSEGRVIESGSPGKVFAAPTSAAAARAVGTENLFSGIVLRSDAAAGCSEVDLGGTRVETGILPDPPGSRVAVGLRAEDVLISLGPLAGTSARNALAGTVISISPAGAALELRVATPVPFRVTVTPASARELGLEVGRSVHLLITAHAFHRLE